MDTFVIKNGVLVTYNGTDEVVTVPTGVTEIGEGCFQGKAFIKEIYLPEWELGDEAEASEVNLKTIHSYAFAGTGIRRIVLPKYAQVEGFAFKGCSMESITGGDLYHLDSLADCAVSDIYLYSGTWLDCWNSNVHGLLHTGLQNCVLHSTGELKSFLIFDYCHYCSRCGVTWQDDTDALARLVADREKYWQLNCAKKEEIEDFRKKNHMKFKEIFQKNSAEFLRLQEEENRLREEKWAYFKLYYEELPAKIKEEEKRLQYYQEKYESIRRWGSGTSFPQIDRETENPTSDGAFVPVPDVTGI
jgi:hypothetical protein